MLIVKFASTIVIAKKILMINRNEGGFYRFKGNKHWYTVKTCFGWSKLFQFLHGNMTSAIVCFWNSAGNMFNSRPGPSCSCVLRCSPALHSPETCIWGWLETLIGELSKGDRLQLTPSTLNSGTRRYRRWMNMWQWIVNYWMIHIGVGLPVNQWD